MAWISVVGEWFYTNTVGNLVASLICFVTAGFVHHVKVVRPLHKRLDAQDIKLHEIHQQTTGGSS